MTTRAVALAVVLGLGLGVTPVGAAPAVHRVATTAPRLYGPRDVHVSGDGGTIVFLAAPDPTLPAAVQAYAYDVKTHRIEAVSVSPSGKPADAKVEPHMGVSANGRYVVFASAASNLVPGDTNKLFGASANVPTSGLDVFVRDRVARRTIRVSVDAAGQQLFGGPRGYGAPGTLPSISPDGSTVTFVSADSRLGRYAKKSAYPVNPGVGYGLFAKSLKTGRVRAVAVDSQGTAQWLRDGLSGNPIPLQGGALSRDGRYVAYAWIIPQGQTTTVKLTTSPWESGHDVALADTVTGRTTIVSDPAVTGPHSSAKQGVTLANPDPWTVSIDEAGQRVAYAYGYQALLSADAFASVFVYTKAGNRVTQVDGHTDEANHFSATPAISGDGTRVAFVEATPYYRMFSANGVPGQLMTVPATGGAPTEVDTCGPSNPSCPVPESTLPSISRTGAVVAFVTSASLDASDHDVPNPPRYDGIYTSGSCLTDGVCDSRDVYYVTA